MESLGSEMSVDRSGGNTRRSSRLSNGSDSASSQIREGGIVRSGGKTKFRSNIQLPGARSPALKPDGDTSSVEDGNDEDGDDDNNEASDEETDVSAPSGTSRKRGHQTGLSVSLWNTSLGKRGRSPGSDEESERPTSKMSKVGTAVDPLADDDNDDDDDDYNAVDDISESDEENDMEQLEEKMIIESEEDSSDHQRRGSASSVESIFALNEAEEDNQPGQQFFLNELFPEATNSLLQEDEDSTAPTTRRVRFAEEVQLHSSSSTTESDEEDEVVYPDLFLQQDSLDPAFRKLIEQKDADERSSDADSYWDFENEQGAVENVGEDGSASESGSSGYETDEGETTDEEILPPRTVSKPQTSLRHNFKAAGRLRGSQSAAATQIRKGTVASVRRGPLMGSFRIDDDKPIAVVDGHGKHMLFFPAPKHRRQVHEAPGADSSPGPAAMSTYHIQSETESDVGFSQTDPMLSSPANVMMSGFSSTRSRSGTALSSEITGPPEAFFPFTSINSNGVIEMDDMDDDTFDDYSDEDDNLRIEDFINFGDDASSSDEDTQQEPNQSTDSNNTTGEDSKEFDKTPQPPRTKIPGIKPRQPSTPTPNPGSLLAHFDKGVVSSFRRNNDRHKSWTRSPVNVGIKGSRLHAANAPISPLRRRRGGSISSGISRSPLRPQTSDAGATYTSNEPQKQQQQQQQQQHQFGGPLKKRIQNSNHIRRERKNTL